MTGWFRRLPIRAKLIAMLMSTSVVVLVLVSAGHLYTDYANLKKDAAADLEAQAHLVLDSAYSSIKFDSEEDAQAILGTFKSVTNVRTACLWDVQFVLIAEYSIRGAGGCPTKVPANGTFPEPNRIISTVSRSDEAGRWGTLMVRSSLSSVERRINEQTTVIGIVILLGLGVATLMSARLHRFISEPVIALSRTAAAVSTQGDYSLRAERKTDDELGVLADSFNRMLERIQSREAELSRANEELRRANRLKDEFLATLSHELRTPLNAILGWTKLLRGKALPADSIDRALEKVERNALAQARLVEDLLEVSRITTGKLRLDVRPLDLVTVAGAAIDSIRPAADAREVKIELAFTAAALPTAGDPDRLQQVIWNLLSNAVKFTPEGGTVTLSIFRGELDELVVSDTGIGIDGEFLPNVFDSFRQADATATRSHGGLGLGLSIVRQLVQLHGGTVAAASAGRDQGATFTVRLPIRTHQREVLAIPRAEENRLPLLTPYTIVAVDDEEDTRELLQSVLENAGARVHAAASADEAVALCRTERPDAIVSDIGMPVRDGYSLMKDLRESLGPDAPRVAIALSAYAAPADRERSLAAGFHWHLAKPFHPADLVETLQDLLKDAASTGTK
ncbi:MAG: hybrid sensor histidine kinase/response regulator [Acidobacteriota bacterium]|nr:hybrid sensor histidine kinase/response regulator [Acidobacteriota bacterium]